MSILSLKNTLALTGCYAAISAFSSVAFAQEDQAEASSTLEEIIVTARKRSESLQSTPIAISAFNAQALEDRGAVNINDITNIVPNMQYSAAASGSVGASSLTIRGIGQSDFITTTEPGVGLYLDGVYLARVTGAALDLADIERVEVLRGPQGTLFGRNTIGGAVNVITKKPSGEFNGNAQLTLGNNNRFNGRFSVDFPIIDDILSGRVAFLSKNSDGYGFDSDPVGGGGNLAVENDIAGRAQLLFTPKENVSFLFSVDHTRRRGTVMPHGRVASTIPNDISLLPKDAPNLVRLSAPIQDDLDVTGGALTTEIGLGEVDLKLITAYRKQFGKSGQDFDGGSDNILDQFITSTENQFSQEIQFTGTSLDNKLDWAVGVYYFKENGQFDSDIVLTGIPITIFTKSDTKSYAAYAQGTYHISDKFDVTGGIRWTSETKGVDVDTFFGPFQLVNEAKNKKFTAFSPKIGLDYQASDDLLVYASVSRGFRSGGFNGRPFSPTDLTPFGEETTTAYEVGFKADMMEKTVRLNVAAFYTDYKDIQLTATTLNDQGQFIVLTANAGKAKIYGLEAELQAKPTKDIFLYGSVGYADNGNVSPLKGFDFDTSTGGNLPGASEWTLSLGGNYDFDVGDNMVGMVGVDYSYRSRYDHQASNQTATVAEDGYGLLNARLTVGPDDEKWKLTFYGKNLTDQVYRVYGQDSMSSFGVAVVWFGPTREFGATLSFNF